MSAEDETILELIAKILVYIWSDARNTSERFTNRDNIRHFSYRGKGYFNIGYKGINGYEKLFRRVKNNIDKFDENFSKRYVEELITNAIYSLLRVEPQVIEEESIKEATKLYDELQKEFETYIISTPIANLEFDIDSLSIGNVILKKFDIPELPEKTEKSVLRLRERNESSIFPQCEDKIMAKVEVHALDRDKAMEIGKNLIEDALDIIRFFGLNMKYPQGYNVQNYFDIQGKITPAQILYLFENPSRHTEILPELSRTGWIAPFTVSEEFFKDMNELGLPIINRILEKLHTERTDIEKRILSAVRLSGSSFMYRDNYEAFIKLMIALEALFIEERETKKDNLAERIAFIITDVLKERLKVYHMMRDLYEIRSEIVHEGNEEVLKKDFIQLQYNAFLVIITMIKTYDIKNIQTINQLKDWVLKERFS